MAGRKTGREHREGGVEQLELRDWMDGMKMWLREHIYVQRDIHNE